MNYNKPDNLWRLEAFRISKYDPNKRNLDGAYESNDWTSFSDIGKDSLNSILTEKEYLEVESKYFLAIKNFFQFHSCENITIRSLEKYPFENRNLSDSFHLKEIYDKIYEDEVVNLNDVEIVTKLILRGMVWCELYCSHSNSTVVRFGYDFYMYFNSKRDINAVVKYVNEIGLYVG